MSVWQFFVYEWGERELMKIDVGSLRHNSAIIRQSPDRYGGLFTMLTLSIYQDWNGRCESFRISFWIVQSIEWNHRSESRNGNIPLPLPQPILLPLVFVCVGINIVYVCVHGYVLLSARQTSIQQVLIMLKNNKWGRETSANAIWIKILECSDCVGQSGRRKNR